MQRILIASALAATALGLTWTLTGTPVSNAFRLSRPNWSP